MTAPYPVSRDEIRAHAGALITEAEVKGYDALALARWKLRPSPYRRRVLLVLRHEWPRHQAALAAQKEAAKREAERQEYLAPVRARILADGATLALVRTIEAAELRGRTKRNRLKKIADREGVGVGDLRKWARECPV